MKSVTIVFLCALLGPLGMSVVRADTVKFPTLGIAFTPPEHASMSLSDSPGCVAMYRFDKTAPNAGAAILVEWAPSHNASVDDMAASLSKDHGGTVDASKLTVGGNKAVKISADVEGDVVTHRITYLVVQGKWAYMFSELNTASADAQKAMDALLPTVVFSEPQSPEKHVGEIFDADFPLFDACTVRMPTCIRKFDNEPKQLDVGISDLTTDGLSQPYAIDIEPIKTEQPVTFADIKEKFSAVMEKKYLPQGEHLKWHDREGLAALHFTESFVATTKHDDGSSETDHLQICMLDVAPGSFVELSIVISDLPRDEVAIYQGVSDKILASMKLMPLKAK